MSKKNQTSMNEELQKWLKESSNDIKKVKSNKKKKKPIGKCQICGEKKSDFICLKCEKSICKSCYFKIIGVCKKCIPPEIAGKWDGSQTDWEKELGVKWVD